MSDEIRRFADSGIQAAVEKAVSQLPATTNGAIVAHADGEGASVSIVERKGAHWDLVVSAYKAYHGKLGAEAAVVYHW